MDIEIVHVETGSVVIGEFRCPPWDPRFRREGAAGVWPSIALPRAAVAFDLESGSVVGDVNTAVFFSAGRGYRRRRLDGRGSHTDWIEVRPDVLASVGEDLGIDRDALRAGRFTFTSAPVSTTAFAARRMGGDWLRLRETGGDLAVEERALRVVRRLLSCVPGGRAVKEGRGAASLAREAVDHVKSVLSLHLNQDLSLDAVAASVGLSGPYLCRVFRRETGVTMRRYRQRLRVRSAVERLASPDKRVLDIALDVGYRSESHLSDAFLEEFGVRPGVFRRGLASGR